MATRTAAAVALAIVSSLTNFPPFYPLRGSSVTRFSTGLSQVDTVVEMALTISVTWATTWDCVTPMLPIGCSWASGTDLGNNPNANDLVKGT